MSRQQVRRSTARDAANQRHDCDANASVCGADAGRSADHCCDRRLDPIAPQVARLVALAALPVVTCCVAGGWSIDRSHANGMKYHRQYCSSNSSSSSSSYLFIPFSTVGNNENAKVAVYVPGYVVCLFRVSQLTDRSHLLF